MSMKNVEVNEQKYEEKKKRWAKNIYTLPVFYSVDYGFDISKLYKISSTAEFKSKASFV